MLLKKRKKKKEDRLTGITSLGKSISVTETQETYWQASSRDRTGPLMIPDMILSSDALLLAHFSHFPK